MGVGSIMLVLIAAASAVRVAVVGARLPERVATHFDGAGNPNGWMTAGGFVGFHAGLLVVVVAVFLGMPALLHRLPVRLINLPNREYWLAPERRAASIDRLRERLSWAGVATVLFVAFVGELVLRVNLAGSARLESVPFAVGLGGYLAFTAGWLVALYRAFRVPSSPAWR